MWLAAHRMPLHRRAVRAPDSVTRSPCTLSSGVGCAAIQHLARKGAKVYMGARNEEKAKAAIEKIQKAGLEPGNGEVVWLPLDYSDPRDAKKAAEAFLEKEERLDILGASAILSYMRDPDGPLTLGPCSELGRVVRPYFDRAQWNANVRLLAV